MKLEECINREKKFKRECWVDWLEVKNGRLIWVTGKHKGESAMESLSIYDILIATDYKIKEEWYEGDFKSKYPNGVFCFVSDNGHFWHRAVIIEYDKNSEYPFITDEDIDYRYVKSISKNEKLPYILTDEED